MPTPHDALFKRVFSQPENAGPELRHALPAAIARHVDWETLALEPRSFVDDELRETHADLLYSAKIGGRAGYLYLLFEHKSWAEYLTAFALCKYKVRIIDDYLRQNPSAKTLPPIIALVVHHSEAGWHGSTELSDLYGLDPAVLEDLRPYLLQDRFALDDVSHESDASLRARALTAVATLGLLCLARARSSRDPLAELVPWADLFRAVLSARRGADALAGVFSYIIRVRNLDRSELGRFVRVEVGRRAETILKTTYEEILAEGRVEGRAEGRAEGRVHGQVELLLKQLALRFGTLTDAVIERVRGASIECLDVWAERVLSAATLDQVLGSD